GGAGAGRRGAPPGRPGGPAPRRTRGRAGRRAVSAAAGVRVVFTPSGKRGSFPAGTSVLDAARALAVDLDSVCGGRGICGRCQVVVSEGEHAKHGLTSRADHLTAFSDAESTYRARSGLAAERRLGCHALMIGDLVIDVP